MGPRPGPGPAAQLLKPEQAANSIRGMRWIIGRRWSTSRRTATSRPEVRGSLNASGKWRRGWGRGDPMVRRLPGGCAWGGTGASGSPGYGAAKTTADEYALAGGSWSRGSAGLRWNSPTAGGRKWAKQRRAPGPTRSRALTLCSILHRGKRVAVTQEQGRAPSAPGGTMESNGLDETTIPPRAAVNGILKRFQSSFREFSPDDMARSAGLPGSPLIAEKTACPTSAASAGLQKT